MKTKTLLFIFLQCCISTAYCAFPPDYTATYDIDKFGTTIGRSTITLVQTDKEIQYSQNVELVGFISFFKKDRVVENSWLTEQNANTVLLKKHQYTHSNSKKNYDSLIEATWTTGENDSLKGEFTGNYHGDTISLNTDKTIWDTLSFQLALMSDASNNSEVYDYTVISQGEIKQYTFSFNGEKIIEVDDKKYKTIELERLSGDKSTRIWLAPDLNYVPVLINQYKNDELESTMTLASIVFNNPLENNEAKNNE